MKVARSTCWRMWLVTRRAYPWTYFASTVLAGALTISLAYLAYRSLGAGSLSEEFVRKTGSRDYVGYVAVGAVAYAFTVRMLLWTAKALITEEREGTIAALVVTPSRRGPYLLGFAVFSFVSTLVEVAALSVFASLLGIQLPVPDLTGLLIAVVLLGLAVFSMSVVLGVVMLFAGEAHISQNTCFLVMGLLCGFTFPRSYLPEPIQWLGEMFPVTPAVEVVRALLRGDFGVSAAPRVTAAVLISAVYLVVGFALLPLAERRVIERTF